jgi:hypothetical protein
MSDKKVVFRRIRGRVVPIRVEQRAKDAATGTAAVAAGAGVAIGAGVVAGNLDIAANTMKSLAFAAGKRSDRLWNRDSATLAVKHAQKAEALFQRAATRFAASGHIKKAGFAASAALIGLGINKVLKATDLDKKPELRGSASTAAGIGASFALNNGYAQKFLKDTTSVQAAKNALTATFKMAARKIGKF